MEQHINSNHYDDENGCPAGGCTWGTGFAISWQNGPLRRGEKRREPNGTFVEGIINAAIDRIQYYQDSKFKCDENRDAITHLKAALNRLNDRTADREKRAVEGTHSV